MDNKHVRAFEGKLVVVTGASAGIGRAIAIAFSKAGANLGLLSRNLERLEGLKQEVEAQGSRAMIFPMDVADWEAMESAATEIVNGLGPIDIWVNNATVSVFSPVIKMKADEYRRVTEVTYLGTVYGTLAALKGMTSRDKGTIIQVGSALSYRGIPLQSAYCAAKHAIQGFHDSLLSELIHDKSRVKVSMVQLSAHNTPQFDWVRSRLPGKTQPVPPIYQPEVAARAVLWAAKHYKREHVVGFPAWKAIYGNHFFPAVGDRYLARFGYDSQQSEELRAVNAPDNLMVSLDGDYGAHGRFDALAKERDIFFEVTKYVPFHYLVFFFLMLLIFILLSC